MKAKHLLFVVAGCCMGFAMSGCKANVDLKNIDKTAELDMGIALPVGSMSATIGDFSCRRAGAEYLCGFA